jgi:GntR family transcriptional regulator
MTGINPRSPVPKYHQLRDILLELVETELEPDAPIPSERELSERYDLSRMTVRQAIDSLVTEGRLFRVPGRGTFVAKTKMDLQIRLASFTEDMRGRGMHPGSKVLGFERIGASAHIAKELELQLGDPVVRLERLRFADGTPMAFERTYLPESLVPGLLERGIEGSLYAALADRYGLALTWGEQTIEAGTAGRTIGELLEIPPGGVVLRMQRHAYADDVLVEYAVSTYRADRYQLWVPLQRPATPFRNTRTPQGGGST